MKNISIKQHIGFTAVLLSYLYSVTGCTSPRSFPRFLDSRGSDTVSYWAGDSMPGKPSVRINLSAQRAYFYKGGNLAGVSLVSTGREGLGTVTGNFHILEKEKEHHSSLFGKYVDANGKVMQENVNTATDPMPKEAHYEGASMPYFMRIVDGTGMHQGFLPGYPASHGCIRMPDFMAEAFYRSVSVGTPVSIQP